MVSARNLLHANLMHMRDFADAWFTARQTATQAQESALAVRRFSRGQSDGQRQFMIE